MDPLTSGLQGAFQGNGLTPPSGGLPAPPMAPQYDEKRLLDLFDSLKRESFEYRWVWEREWLRDLYYVANRQWIYFHPTKREWVDKRLSKWVPRPVTNKMAESLQAIRANLAAISLSATVRPVGHDTQSIAAAEIADQMEPLIAEEHLMMQVMKEADFWFITTGNACIQVSWEKDVRSNRVFIPKEQCVTCQATLSPQEILNANNTCPQCGGTGFMPAQNPDGTPMGDTMSFGKGKSTALSPFEYAIPPNVTRWNDLPYLIRLRWRDKHWFEANQPDLIPRISWEKSPADRSLQIFKSLAVTNDIGTGAQFAYLGSAGAHTVEGVTEYEVWLKPTPEFPDGFVMRVLGDKDPILLQRPEEGLPGPNPYKDIEGNPLFPFVHAQYEHMGGRIYGRSAISPLIQKQDQLNQLDSLIQLIVQRMANPIWVVPEGAGIDHFTGEPGLVMKWNPLAANGNAKPERIPGENVPPTLYQLRQQILEDIEQLAGTYDIIKGQKPTGVEAFSALQLLVERSQSRFTSAFQARGEMYRSWFALALELERKFGPQQRTQAIVAPNRGYTFRHFENAQLQGQVAVMVEDGSTMPKTTLGKRAAIEQANQLMLLNPQDPDQKYALLTQFGLVDLVPSLNFHVQSALQMQDSFEQWAAAPQGPSPLVMKPWFDPQVHWVERVKWLNSDRMREMLQQTPVLEQIVTANLLELQAALAMAMGGVPGGVPGQPGPPGAPPGPPGAPPSGPHAPGGGQALHHSNQQSGALSSVPHGINQGSPHQGPI